MGHMKLPQYPITFSEAYEVGPHRFEKIVERFWDITEKRGAENGPNAKEHSEQHSDVHHVGDGSKTRLGRVVVILLMTPLVVVVILLVAPLVGVMLLVAPLVLAVMLLVAPLVAPLVGVMLLVAPLLVAVMLLVAPLWWWLRRRNQRQ